MHEGLLDNILVELCNRWTNVIESKMKETDVIYQSCDSSITTLLNASRNHHANIKKTIIGKLSKFRVGTEKAKSFRSIAKESELIPLPDMKTSSTKRLIDERLHMNNKNTTVHSTAMVEAQICASPLIILKRDQATLSLFKL